MRLFQKFLTTTILSVGIASGAMAEEAASADTVLATVNGKEITLGHMIVLTERLPAQYAEIPVADLFEGILDQMIQQEALSAKATISDQRLQLSSDNERRALLATDVLDDISADVVTPEAVKAAYDEFVATNEPTPEFDASHILVETEQEAIDLIAKIEGGADFAFMAQEHSTGPSGPNGGSLGWFGRGAMVPEFDLAVAEMEVGAVSAPVRTQFGWHIIKLNNKRDFPALADMAPQLSEGVRTKAIEKKVADVLEQADVVRNEPTFDLNLIRDQSLVK
ncbi:peptidylprolyl isomerase [Amylibacter marinus]|uniref:Parvulin-like PPIase n=1 Tax=Amylibacter marinus TaxID=1475483 RepID=A0ABQ5VVU5_9RHOB|nr:peptidylprolyl isomerase [Amylibacter marinus]GLQ35555.1 peptidylprolyl isomerase [Amylibacter marinus]